MSIVYIGEQDFVKQSLPIYSKNEFGMDVMTIRYRGPAFALESFLNALTQGDQDLDDDRFYLQTWNVDESPTYPTVTLIHKGLIDGIPNPLTSTETSMQSLTVTTDSLGYNASLDMQFWAPKTVYNFISDGIPESNPYTDGGNDNLLRAFSKVYRIN